MIMIGIIKVVVGCNRKKTTTNKGTGQEEKEEKGVRGKK
jgi:hypothetical protein